MDSVNITLDNVWANARLLSDKDKNILRERISDILNKKNMCDSSGRLESLAGAWKDDPRSTEEIIASIRALRTANAVPSL